MVMVRCPNCGSKSGDKFSPRYVGVAGKGADLYECQQCHTLISHSDKGGTSSIW